MIEQLMEGDSQETQHDTLEKLLKENLEVATQNNKILRRMERNALVGFLAKIFMWLLILGVPLIFLGPYLKPLLGMLSGTSTGASSSASPLGVPSGGQLQELLDAYSGK